MCWGFGYRVFRWEFRRKQATVTPWWTLPLHQCCCPPLLPAELFAALLLSQGNSRPDTLQRLSAPTQNNSTLCLLNKSWSLQRKAATLVSSLPACPNDYIFPVSPSSPPCYCTKHDLRSVSPPGPQCYQQSCWISFSLGRNVDRLQSPHVQ